MKIAICDRDNPERNRYFTLLSDLAKKHKVKAEFILYSKCEEMLFHFEDKEFMDIVFLGAEMSGMSGVEAAGKLRKFGYKGEIVFLAETVTQEILLAGYDVDALHVIIQEKTPPEKIEEIFLKAKDAAESKNKKYILFTASNEWINIPLNSIQYFETYKRLVTVYYGNWKGNQQFDFYSQTFESVVQEFIGTEFIRTHRSYLVAIKEIEQLSFYTLVTRNGTKLPVGRTYYPKIKEALKAYDQIHKIV